MGSFVGLLLGLGHLRDGGLPAIADDLLGQDAVADVGLEVLIRDALLTGGLFSGHPWNLHMVLLANLVEPANDLGIGVRPYQLLGA